jgi:hypothetical protein
MLLPTLPDVRFKDRQETSKGGETMKEGRQI